MLTLKKSVLLLIKSTMTVCSPIQREIQMNVGDFNNTDCFILMLKLPTDKPGYLDQYKNTSTSAASIAPSRSLQLVYCTSPRIKDIF